MGRGHPTHGPVGTGEHRSGVRSRAPAESLSDFGREKLLLVNRMFTKCC